jgi:hypothetical protein
MVDAPLDLRQARLAVVKGELRRLNQSIRGMPVGSPERDALADRIGEMAGQAIALAEELEG